MRTFGHKRGRGRPLVVMMDRQGRLVVFPAKDRRHAGILAADLRARLRPLWVEVVVPAVDDDGNDMWMG